MVIRLRDEEAFSLELTPMIDVVFLLIVFFLLATTFQQLERELDVAVPKSRSGTEGSSEPDPVVVNVLPDAAIIVGGNRVDPEQLYALLARRVEQEPGTKALIRAHGQLAFERVVEVADACRRARAAIAFATLHEEP
ncbi:MAG: ExbD/TolR family protein [Planctomycetota bacterium]